MNNVTAAFLDYLRKRAKSKTRTFYAIGAGCWAVIVRGFSGGSSLVFRGDVGR